MTQTMHVVIALALAGLAVLAEAQPSIPTLTPGAEGTAAGGHPQDLDSTKHHRQAHLHRLPHCNRLFEKLPSHSDVEALRDLLQQSQAMQRKQGDLEVLIHNQLNPHEELKVRLAFKTDFTVEQLQAQLSEISKLLEQISSSYSQELTRLGIDPGFADQLKSCLLARLNPLLYPERPKVSFMLQYFKRPWMIGQIVETLRGCQQYVPVELVVNVDEPSNATAWAEYAANSSGFVVPVFEANVHEIRAYNRLGDMARGKYLITHQDDELMPKSCSWILDVVGLMEQHPGMGVMGMRGFLFNMKANNINAGTHFKDRKLGLPFQFVSQCDFSPMVIRKSAFRQVGGLDEGLSDPGECGIWSDWELSSRMWAAGWQVGFHWLPDREGDRSGVDSGTHKPETGHRCWGRQQGAASGVYHRRWQAPFQADVEQLVKRLNHQLLEPTFAKCPFSPDVGGCDLWLDSYPPAKIPSTAQDPKPAR